jgi:glutathione S-transferase
LENGSDPRSSTRSSRPISRSTGVPSRERKRIAPWLSTEYPRALLGIPPGWYKSKGYRSRAVHEPRAVLLEFDLALSHDVRVRVHDSTADLRFSVVRGESALRPAGKAVGLRGIVVDLAMKQNLESDFLAMNPSGLVPVLREGDHVVTESSVINEYLEDAYPGRPLRPDTPAARAAMRLWTKHVDEVLHPAWPPLAWPVLIRPRWMKKSAAEIETLLAAMPDGRKRERQRSMLALGTDAPEYRASCMIFAGTLDRMEARLVSDSWLAGATLSLADLALLPYIFVADLFGLADWMFASRPACADWYQSIGARPALGDGLRGHYPPAQIEEVTSTAGHLITA